MKYVILALIWISYVALHSAMITPKFTNFLQRQLDTANTILYLGELSPSCQVPNDCSLLASILRRCQAI